LDQLFELWTESLECKDKELERINVFLSLFNFARAIGSKDFIEGEELRLALKHWDLNLLEKNGFQGFCLFESDDCTEKRKVAGLFQKSINAPEKRIWGNAGLMECVADFARIVQASDRLRGIGFECLLHISKCLIFS